VGAAQGIPTLEAEQYAADAMGSSEIARILGGLVADLTDEYQASLQEGAEPLNVPDRVQIVVEGASVTDHWRNPSDKTYFALASLGEQGVRESVEGSFQDLDPGLRAYLLEHAASGLRKLADSSGPKRALHILGRPLAGSAPASGIPAAGAAEPAGDPALRDFAGSWLVGGGEDGVAVFEERKGRLAGWGCLLVPGADRMLVGRCRTAGMEKAAEAEAQLVDGGGTFLLVLTMPSSGSLVEIRLKRAPRRP
jgi:hypothetical protein